MKDKFGDEINIGDKFTKGARVAERDRERQKENQTHTQKERQRVIQTWRKVISQERKKWP